MPNSTPDERLLEAKRLYFDAANHKIDDLKLASTKAEVNKVLRNVERAEETFIAAGLAILEGNSAAIEQAYQSAKAANDQVTQARENAEAIAEKIRKVSQAINLVGDLVKKASA